MCHNSDSVAEPRSANARGCREASLPLSDSPRYPFLGVKQPRSRLKTKRTQATACGCEVRRAYRMSQARDVRKKRQISLISGENCLGLPRINPRWESCHFRPRTVKEKAIGGGS